MVKVYIDGQEGTTGLKILERFKNRSDIELLRIDEDKRKDADERRKLIHSADFTFLCQREAIQGSSTLPQLTGLTPTGLTASRSLARISARRSRSPRELRFPGAMQAASSQWRTRW